MKTEFTRQRRNLMANYGHNALIQLIAASAVGFILAYGIYVIILVVSPDQEIVIDQVRQKVRYGTVISPYIGLQGFAQFLHRPWSLLTYAWAHTGFLNLLSNMLWLYCFGSVIQSLMGYKEIIPLFLISYLTGGCIYLGVTAAWPGLAGGPVLGATPGVIGFALAAITLAPKFKFYLGDRFSIPLWAVLCLFLILNVLSYASGNYGMLVLCAGSALTGFAYIRLLRSGYRPGAWLYRGWSRVQGWFAPDDYDDRQPKKRTDTPKPMQQRTKTPEESIDMLLDKINQKGYDSLTNEEKEILLKASREN